MNKKSIKEEDLIHKINDSLKSQWIHKNSYCRIESISESSSGQCNWEVDTFSTGGKTLEYEDLCSQLQEKVLREFKGKYDVDWE